MGNIYKFAKFIALIENNKESYPILNQIYDILAELHNQGKQITM